MQDPHKSQRQYDEMLVQAELGSVVYFELGSLRKVPHSETTGLSGTW